MTLNHTARNEAFQEVIDRFKRSFCEDCKDAYEGQGIIFNHRSCLRYFDAIKSVESMIFEVPKG